MEIRRRFQNKNAQKNTPFFDWIRLEFKMKLPRRWFILFYLKVVLSSFWRTYEYWSDFVNKKELGVVSESIRKTILLRSLLSLVRKLL